MTRLLEKECPSKLSGLMHGPGAARVHLRLPGRVICLEARAAQDALVSAPGVVPTHAQKLAWGLVVQ